jgi:hypothetical protein
MRMCLNLLTSLYLHPSYPAGNDMRRTLPLAFLALTSPGIALAATCPKPDPAAVVKTMTDMFAALTVG